MVPEPVTPESVGMNSGQLARVGEHLRARYVDPGKIPGSITLVARHGRVCYLDTAGRRDVERDTPMTADTILRIYSMTKPVTSVALMTLYERGLFSLDDPVHRFIPAWKKLRVRKGGSHPLFLSVPCERPMTVRDLFMHTSGLTYDFMHASNVDAAYRELSVGLPRRGYTLQQMIDQLAALPLEFSPGQRWNYSVATDVLGYLIEVISGQSLPEYMRSAIFEPLGMVDTSFRDSCGQGRSSCLLLRAQPAKGNGATGRLPGQPFRQSYLLVRRRGPAVHCRGLLPFLPDAAQWRQPRGAARDRLAHPAIHDPQPPAGRHGYVAVCHRQFQ